MDSSQNNKTKDMKQEYVLLHDVLDYSMHELPAGVLWNPNAATEPQCKELMAALDRFVEICKALDVQADEFTEACRWHLEHYPHYLSRRRYFGSYEEYIRGRRGPCSVPPAPGRLE
jgi:hypothetical protein